MRLLMATTFTARMAGLLFRRDLVAGDVLMLVPCRDIHTVGMRSPIDVAFLDDHGVVCRSYRRLAPGRRLSCEDACAVLERFSPEEGGDVPMGEVPSGLDAVVYDDWFHEGERLGILGYEKECLS